MELHDRLKIFYETLKILLQNLYLCKIPNVLVKVFFRFVYSLLRIEAIDLFKNFHMSLEILQNQESQIALILFHLFDRGM